jgi:hypothetical protein
MICFRSKLAVLLMHSKHNKGDINEPRAEEDEHQVMEDDPDDCALIEKN